MVKVTREEVFNKLHISTWKHSFRILDEIAADRNISPDQLDILNVTRNLINLWREGYADRSESYEDQEKVKNRGGRPYAEYLLTQDGLREREKVVSGEVEGLEKVFVC